MNCEQIAAELELLQPLRDALKVRAMVYQAELKEFTAECRGLPADSFFDLPYSQWEVIRAEHGRDLSNARRFFYAVERANNTRQRARNLTRLWNFADHQSNCETLWLALAWLAPDRFYGPAHSLNCFRFAY